jgi:hypothetical protein
MWRALNLHRKRISEGIPSEADWRYHMEVASIAAKAENGGRHTDAERRVSGDAAVGRAVNRLTSPPIKEWPMRCPALRKSSAACRHKRQAGQIKNSIYTVSEGRSVTSVTLEPKDR